MFLAPAPVSRNGVLKAGKLFRPKFNPEVNLEIGRTYADQNNKKVMQWNWNCKGRSEAKAVASLSRKQETLYNCVFNYVFSLSTFELLWINFTMVNLLHHYYLPCGILLEVSTTWRIVTNDRKIKWRVWTNIKTGQIKSVQIPTRVGSAVAQFMIVYGITVPKVFWVRGMGTKL